MNHPMTRLTFALSALLILVALPALAQKTTPAAPKPAKQPATLGISPGEVTATPEMWFYQQQLQQYQDPKVAVRAKAELRAAARMHRITARKWFGFSNQRPTAGVDPYHGDYSPSWTGNNCHYPFRWDGYGQPWVTAYPAVPVTRMY